MAIDSAEIMKYLKMIAVDVGEFRRETNQRLSRLEEGVTDLQKRMTSVEEGISDLRGRMTSMEGRMTSLEGRMANIEERSTRIEGEIKLVNRSLKYIREDLSVLRLMDGELEERIEFLEQPQA